MNAKIVRHGFEGHLTQPKNARSKTSMVCHRSLTSILVVGFFLFAFQGDALAQPPRIVFSSNDTGRWQISIMNLDGSHIKRLTNLPDENVTPALSRDGRMVAFTAYHRGGNRGERSIYVMNVDGSGLRRLTTPPMSGELPAFSPDGRRIAFAGWPQGVGTGAMLIHIMNVDGSHVVNTGVLGTAPSFAPDGNGILFTCQANPRHVHQICITDDTGARVTLLTDARYESEAGSFSSDGTHIVFASQRSEDGSYPWFLIYLMNADGSAAHRIEQLPSRGADPFFAPDGRIVFTRRRLLRPNGDYGDAQICVMEIDGKAERCLTHGPKQNAFRPFGISF
jgi:TolB protein